MATSAFAPAYELDGARTTVTAAYAVSGLLDAWYLQSHLPVSNTANGRWLMDRIGYVKPQNRLTPGREYPAEQRK